MRCVIGVLCRQGQAGMRATIDEEGRHVRLPAERRRCVVDHELCERQLLVPIVLAAVGIRLQRVADNREHRWPVAPWRWYSCGSPSRR